MNREEFCQLMIQRKSESGITTSDLSFQLRMLLPTLRRFEKGEHNFAVEKAIEYLAQIGYCIKLDGLYKLVLNEPKQLSEWIAKARKSMFTQRALAEAIHVSYVSIANIETGKNKLSIDMFLNIVNVLGYSIDIVKR